MFSFGDVSRLPEYSRDEKVWLYDHTRIDNVVALEAPMVKYARRVCTWLERKKAA